MPRSAAAAAALNNCRCYNDDDATMLLQLLNNLHS
jgi:hypothetical protein